MSEYQLANELVNKYSVEVVESAKTIYRYESALVGLRDKVSLGELIRLQDAINATQEKQDLAVAEMHFWADFRNTCPLPYDMEHGYSYVGSDGCPTGDTVEAMEIIF